MNPIAAQGFARGAEAYARARPSYPVAAVDRLREALALGPRSTVLDLGAGTGKLTALLTGLGHVLAVEPVAEMRAKLAAFSWVEVREGSAEDLPLGEAVVDAILIGQAFHWFATTAVLRELRRVLRPGGGLGLLWNRWDRRVAWADALKTLTAPHDAQRPQYETGGWQRAFDAQACFGPLAHAEFENGHSLPRADLLDRMASTSTIALLPEPERAALLGRLRQVLDQHPQTAGKPELVVPYLTDVYWARRL